jgi:hypothetical protein
MYCGGRQLLCNYMQSTDHVPFRVYMQPSKPQQFWTETQNEQWDLFPCTEYNYEYLCLGLHSGAVLFLLLSEIELKAYYQ